VRTWTPALLGLSVVVLCVVACARRVQAAEVQVAVAANFAGPMQQIAVRFASDTGHKAVVASGSTGRLLAQIENGAPFDVLLAADETAPTKLERDGFAVPGSRFTYATGRLVLWSAKPGYVDPAGAVLARGDFRHVALADPRLAPYGAAAVEVLRALGLLEALRPRFVLGESVAQAHQFVATGNAELGFVALSQLDFPGAAPVGSRWLVPASLHPPILQDAVLLRRGEANPAARALCEYLRSPRTKELIRAWGYGLAP